MNKEGYGNLSACVYHLISWNTCPRWFTRRGYHEQRAFVIGWKSFHLVFMVICNLVFFGSFIQWSENMVSHRARDRGLKISWGWQGQYIKNTTAYPDTLLQHKNAASYNRIILFYNVSRWKLMIEANDSRQKSNGINKWIANQRISICFPS